MKKKNNDNRQKQVEKKSKKKIYKEYRLRDINDFEKYFAWSLKEKTIKPIFDRYIKNRLEKKLNKYGIKISAEDYNINSLVIYKDNFELKIRSYPDMLKPNSPFHLYYNYKFKSMYESIGAHIGETILSEFSFNEINNKPREIIKYFYMVIGGFIHDSFREDFNLLYLLEGDIEKMQELSQREKIKKYLKENNIDLKNANIRQLAKDFVNENYLDLKQSGNKKNKINSIRIELVNMRKNM